MTTCHFSPPRNLGARVTVFVDPFRLISHPGLCPKRQIATLADRLGRRIVIRLAVVELPLRLSLCHTSIILRVPAGK